MTNKSKAPNVPFVAKRSVVSKSIASHAASPAQGARRAKAASVVKPLAIGVLSAVVMYIVGGSIIDRGIVDPLLGDPVPGAFEAVMKGSLLCVSFLMTASGLGVGINRMFGSGGGDASSATP